MASLRPLERRRRVMRRALPLGGIAIIAFGAGLAVGAATDSGAQRTAKVFARAWERSDYRSMHRLLTPEAASRYPLAAFRKAYEEARATATSESFTVGDEPSGKGPDLALTVKTETRIFGTIEGRVPLPITSDRVAWSPRAAFPGLRDEERLGRAVDVPERAALASVDGKTLAAGPANARTNPDPAGASVAGRVEPTDDPAERRRIVSRGFPPDTPVGVNYLERAMQLSLEGTPGGRLLAGTRTLASTRPKPARTAQTTIDTRVQAAADGALAGRYGGITVLDARTGEIRALAGVAFSAPQPPGSTFKILTSVAALEGRDVTLGKRFPVQTEAEIDGVPLENSNGESCGGTFEQSFAHSCNSVFAPLGVKVGAKRLVATAERFGFNAEPRVPGAAMSTIPPAVDMKSKLDVGSSAIGQGRVLATPLQMASVAQAIASGGVMQPPTLTPTVRLSGIRVTTPAIAGQVGQMMRGVVRYGTGTAAAIPGVGVAGKTGTAELEDTRGPTPETEESPEPDPSNTDAWFSAYAPARTPRVAIGVLFVRNGTGGETAAPAAREAILGALKAKPRR